MYPIGYKGFGLREIPKGFRARGDVRKHGKGGVKNSRFWGNVIYGCVNIEFYMFSAFIRCA